MGRPPNDPPEKIKRLIDALAKVLNEQIRSSEQVQQLIARIGAEGYEATISLAVLVGLVGLEDPDDAPPAQISKELSAFDAEFLDSLHIKFPPFDGEKG